MNASHFSVLNFRNATLAVALLAPLVPVAACSSSSGGSSAPDSGALVEASTDAPSDATADAHAPADGGADAHAPVTDGGADATGDGSTSQAFNVFDHIPMFNMYSSTPPTNYTPPAGMLMWQNGTVFVTQLTAQQQSLIGADLIAQVTYYAQCDNYDRIGGVFVLIEPKGQAPQPTDPRIELARFITPFSDYSQGPAATYAFPQGSLAAFANVLADGTHDVWIGMGGGSYPTYSGNPCTGLTVDAGSDFLEVGFSYSLDFISTKALGTGTATAIPAFTLPTPPPEAGAEAGAPYAISNVPLTSTPLEGTLTNPGSSPLSGHVTIIVSGHGSAQGGDEYENTQDTVALGSLDPDAGTFSTQINCQPYAAASPDGNPGIFQDNLTFNPRNWCPGALVVSHTFPATLAPGSNDVSVGIVPGQVPSGSYFQTSITFTSP